MVIACKEGRYLATGWETKMRLPAEQHCTRAWYRCPS